MFRRSMAIAAAAVLVLAGALVAQPASATVIGPQGGPTAECKAAGYDFGVKLDTGTPGEYEYGDPTEASLWEPDGLPISITVSITDDDTFTWTADPPVAAVLIKAGLGYTILLGGTSGGGSTANGKDISHITFCYDDEPQNEPEEHLTVTKTVATSWHRTHNWDLTKTADATDVYLYAPGGAGSGTATVTWDVTVDYVEPPTDSAFLVEGTITVLNDGDGGVSVNEVTDTIRVADVDTPVTVDCGADLSVTPASLAEGESLVCTYAYEPTGPIDGVNTATASTVSGNTYESLAVPVVFDDDPTTETNKTVTVTDVSDLLGTQSMDFTAPTGGVLPGYSHTFEWDDYEVCGDYSYDNTATLTSGETVLDTASTTLDVHVQCVIFDGETAWAAQGAAGKDRYTMKGNWATYVTYTGDTWTYPIYAGQTTFVGWATVAPSGSGVTVTVDLMAPWTYAEGSGANLKIQGYNAKPSGNPSPGLFASHTTCTSDPCTSGTIAVKSYYGIHVDVGRWIPDPDFGP